jgi:2-(1,2-epoxy-1,2-dihydrophenyl)acetyl-CoA isomerase
MPTDIVHVRRDGAVALVTLQRTEALNALDEALVTALGAALAELASDAQMRAVVLTGSGRAFCAGGDVKAFLAHLDDDPAGFLRKIAGGFHERVVLPLRRMPKPVIAAINGVVAGGGVGLALACDLRVASSAARITLAYPNIGLTVDGGGSFFLPRMVGLGRALELMLLSEPVDAQEALRLGLVNRVVEPDALLPEALEMARRLAAGPTAAYGMIKELANQSFSNDLPAQLDAELERMAAAAKTQDHREGLRAFAEKRRATFVGR